MNGITSTSPITTTVPSSEAGGESFSYDPQFKGPVKERSCTDVICLFLFVSFIAGWVVVSIFAFRYGDPRILLNPTDSQGNICGMYTFQDKPFLYFFDLTKCASPKVIFKGCPTPQVCVKSCPTENFMVTSSSGDEVKSKLICINGTDMSKPVSELISSNMCANMYLSSKPVVRRCIPDIFLKVLNDSAVILDKDGKPMKTDEGDNISVKLIKKASKTLARFLNTKQFGEQVFSDFKAVWHIMLIGLLLCMVVCLIWIVLMRWIAGCMVWLSILAVTGLSAYCCYFSVTKYLELKKKAEEPTPEADFTKNLGSFVTSKKTWLGFAVVTGLIFVILFLVLIFLRKRILIAIALIKEGSRAVSCMLSTLAFPILPYVLQLAVISFWAAVALYISSSSKASFEVTNAASDSPVANGTECKPWEFNITTAQCLFKDYGKDHLSGGQFYNLFAMLWSVFFIIGVGEVSLAGAFASYYWALNKPQDIQSCAIVTGFYRCLRYHLGSVAFGSLLIATVRFIRIILEYVEAKCKKFDNQVTRAIMWCLRCCFWCLEKFIKFISKNAYIMVAVYGKNFCVSAKTAFMLLLRNAIRVVVLDKVTDFLLLFGKLAMVGLAASASSAVFIYKVGHFKKVIPELHFDIMPVVVITVGSYFIASIFFNVYNMAVDTLFLCFLEDIERNDGSPERPYYMSKELMKILDKKNKFREPTK